MCEHEPGGSGEESSLLLRTGVWGSRGREKLGWQQEWGEGEQPAMRDPVPNSVQARVREWAV